MIDDAVARTDAGAMFHDPKHVALLLRSERRAGRPCERERVRLGRSAGIGRIRLRRIPTASPSQLVAFVKHMVEPGSVVITDGWKGYAGLKQEGFKHRPRLINASGKTASALLPRVHRVASLLRRWVMGIHQGALSREQLDTYLDEFTFRFNRRTSRNRWKLFYGLVAQAVAIEPVPNSRLVTVTS